VVPEYAKPKPVKNIFQRTATKGTGMVKKLLTKKKDHAEDSRIGG
jgi:hypothetical protein